MQDGGGVPTSTGDSEALVAYLEEHAAGSRYLVATFGAQSAAGLILATDGGSVLPIGGFNGADPVPTLAAFEAMVAAGEVRYVLTSGGGMGGQGQGTASTSTEIRAWVTEHCTSVAATGVSGLVECG